MTSKEKIIQFLITISIFYVILFLLSKNTPFTGDELGTLDIGGIHKPIPYKLFLSWVLSSISANPENIFYIRLTSAAFTILAIILWHIFILNDKKELFIFNALILTSSFLVRESIYFRYYSYYFLSSSIFLIYLVVLTKNLNKKWKLTSSIIFTILSPYLFFTLNALQFGMYFFSVFIIEFVKRPITRVIFLFLPFILMLGVLIKPISLWWLLDFFNLSDHGHINFLSNSIRGLSLSILIKPFYALYQMFFGYDILPTESIILIILIISIAIIFCYILYLQYQNERTKFIYYCFCFIVPFIMIYYFFEAVSLPGFTQLETKHGMLIYPFLLLMIVKSPKYLTPLVTNLFLGIIFISHIIGMYASLSQKDPDWGLVYDNIDNFVRNGNNTLILMDGRSSGTFSFYAQHNVNDELIQYTWEPIDSLTASINNNEKMVLLLNDWKSYTPLTIEQNWNAASGSLNRVKGLDSLLVLLNRDYQLVDSYINYPTFLYLLEKKEQKSDEKSFGVWEYHLKDLTLPIDNNSRNKIFSSLLIQPGDSVMIKPDSAIVLNLEKSDDIHEGGLVGTITANGKEIYLIKGENIWDIFADFYDENVDENKVFHSWYHTPLVSGSIRYKGSYFKHKARNYKINLAQKVNDKIKIINTSIVSSIRIWI